MDDRRFDALARSLAVPRTRRGLLAALAALGAGVFGARGGDAQVSQVYCGNQMCASNPSGCKPGCVCCIYTNAVGQVTNSRCRPPGTCSPGTEAGGATTPPPTTTTSPPTTTTTTTTTTTATPGCPSGSTDCNGVCCASSCQCLQRLDGGLSCVNATQGRSCTGGESGACDNGFACIQGICRGICGPPEPPTTTSTPCLALGDNCINSTTCCNFPDTICSFVTDGVTPDPPLLCCKPNGGSCLNAAQCCDGRQCLGGICSA